MNVISNWKTYMKFLSRNKGYTAIDLFGLSVSLMFVLFIAVYTWQELSTDKFQEKADRIYWLGSEETVGTCGAVPYALKERYPEIEKVCPLVISGISVPAETEGRRVTGKTIFADTTFFDVFSFRLLQGDPQNALVATTNAIVSESFARKLFGTDNVLGRSFSNDTLHYTVAGVIEDIKHSCIPEADIILPWRAVKDYNQTVMPGEAGNAAGVTCAILTYPGADLKAKTGDILSWIKDVSWIYQRGIWKEVRLEKLSDFYFSGWSSYFLHTGDRRFVLVLMSVGILILLFAVLNYINLTVAQAGFRAKEMATRRLLGSTRMELFWRLMSESMMMCLLAWSIAMMFAFLLDTFANDLLQTKLDLTVLFSPVWLGAALLFVIIVGGISGWLPATVISNAKPIEVVRGTLRVKTKMVFSKVFITFQNFITIVMLSCSIVMISQILHMVHAPLGYNTKNLYWALVQSMDASEQQVFRDKVSSLSGVKRIGFTQGLPLLGSENFTTRFEDGGVKHNISFQQYPMDQNAFEMLGLEIKQDNHLANPRWYLNEEAMRQMNLSPEATSASIEGVMGGGPFVISGIVSDFREGNINDQVSAVMLRFLKPDEEGWIMLVEMQGDAYAIVDQMKEIYGDLTGGLTMEGNFLEKRLQESFQSQIRLAKIVGVFTFVAVLISLLGLLAMSTYFIQQRSLEVAVRKVFGSDNRQILTQLVKTFLMYVVFAFFLAVPVAYYFMSDWLADYSYRIALNPFIFIGAGLFCLLISFLTVFYQSWKAANANPIESFRNKNQ